MCFPFDSTHDVIRSKVNIYPDIYRMPLTPVDIAQVLSKVFEEENPRPSVERCEELARETGLDVKQVSTWFRERRKHGSQKMVGYAVAQRDCLLEAFEQYGSCPPKEIHEQLARKLGLTRIQVWRWFYYRRNRGGAAAGGLVARSRDDDFTQGIH